MFDPGLLSLSLSLSVSVSCDLTRGLQLMQILSSGNNEIIIIIFKSKSLLLCLLPLSFYNIKNEPTFSFRLVPRVD